MATQQDKIREMANKKLLNGEQKKVLYKLFEAKITEKVQSIDRIFRTNVQKKRDEILEAGRKSKSVQAIIARINKAKQDEKVAERELEKAGYGLDYHGEFELASRNKEIDKLEDANAKKLSKIEDLKLKLLADIHGLPMTYDEMTSYINGELEKLIAE